jgi:hypothetical protein
MKINDVDSVTKGVIDEEFKKIGGTPITSIKVAHEILAEYSLLINQILNTDPYTQGAKITDTKSKRDLKRLTIEELKKIGITTIPRAEFDILITHLIEKINSEGIRSDAISIYNAISLRLQKSGFKLSTRDSQLQVFNTIHFKLQSDPSNTFSEEGYLASLYQLVEESLVASRQASEIDQIINSALLAEARPNLQTKFDLKKLAEIIWGRLETTQGLDFGEILR